MPDAENDGPLTLIVGPARTTVVVELVVVAPATVVVVELEDEPPTVVVVELEDEPPTVVVVVVAAVVVVAVFGLSPSNA